MSKPADRSTVRRTSHSRPGSRPRGPRARVGRLLWEWATQEMKYSTGEGGTLTQEELQMLVVGESTEFWEFITKHVKSPSNAEVIRGNIFLHTAGGGGGTLSVPKTGEERGVMERERRELVREEESLKMAVQQMQRDVAQLRESITQLDVAGGGVRGEVSRLSRGSAMLSAHSHVSHEMISAVHEFADVFRPVAREASYFTMQRGGEEEGRRGEKGSLSHGLESACTHEVRVICSQLEEALSSSDSGGQRVTERKRAREHSWKQIESLLTCYPPAGILSSLAEVTQQTAHQLHSHTLSIDLNRDARQLKYSYDVAGMRDLSEEPRLLHAVEEQLLEAQLSHIQRSVESERAQKAARVAHSQAAELQAASSQLLQECYQDVQDSDALELAKLHARLDVECAGSSAALEKLSGLCSSLGVARDQRKATVEGLKDKHRRIQEFALVADFPGISESHLERMQVKKILRSIDCAARMDSKQRKIQALVVHNSSAKDRILKQSMELRMYIQQNVLSHRERLSALAGQLKDCVTREVHLFSGLALDRLLQPPGVELPTCDLTINCLNPEHPSGHPLWSDIVGSLQLPAHSAPDRLLAKLLDSQEKVSSLDRNVQKVNQMLHEMRVIAVDKESTDAILQRCQDHDHDLVERGVPAVQECLSRASCGLADCKKTAETLEHWWVQPAQFLTPWATHTGVTSAQWVEQWRTLAAKFSELQEQQ